MDEHVTWGVIDDAIEGYAAEAGDSLPSNLIGLWDDNLRKELSKHILRHLNATRDGATKPAHSSHSATP